MGHKEEILGRLNQAFSEALLWGYISTSIVATGDSAQDIEEAIDIASDVAYDEGYGVGYEDAKQAHLEETK